VIPRLELTAFCLTSLHQIPQTTWRTGEFNRWVSKSTTLKEVNMKSKTLRVLCISQAVILLLFLFLTLGNEIVDVPHYIFNDAPTSYSQRSGEITIEIAIFIFVMVIQIILFRKLYSRIRILEGFIPICANCKKVRSQEEQWEKIEKYITEHSLARFSHSICPDCVKQLYPDLYNDKM